MLLKRRRSTSIDAESGHERMQTSMQLADISGAATNDGAQVIQWTADGGAPGRGFESFPVSRSSLKVSRDRALLSSQAIDMFDTTSRPRLSFCRTGSNAIAYRPLPCSAGMEPVDESIVDLSIWRPRRVVTMGPMIGVSP